MALPLSKRQKGVFEFIRRRIIQDNLPPTIREIAGYFKFSSTGTVRDHLNALARKGYIKLGRQKARSIELVRGMFGIPVLGRVAAGGPQQAQEEIEGYLDPAEFFNPEEDLFALKVKGDSMIEAGIFEGDIVTVRKQSRADDGDIVVALIADEATVKFFKKRGKFFFLVPANKKYKAFLFSENSRILGKVTKVLRRYV
jgi:repressor LexA